MGWTSLPSMAAVEFRVGRGGFGGSRPISSQFLFVYILLYFTQCVDGGLRSGGKSKSKSRKSKEAAGASGHVGADEVHLAAALPIQTDVVNAGTGLSTVQFNPTEDMTRKFDHIDSRFNAYELDRNRPLVDQNTIDDIVKASVEERLKVLGVGKSHEKNDKLSIVGEEQSLSLPPPQQKSVNSPALAMTPGLVFTPKRNLANELDKDTGVKRTLAEEFGSGTATPVKSPELDFSYCKG
ncbi:hypothetical protein Bca52824_016201 [Brassica carinata]|uniref:Uncharacterized protein n=1 Tax=Brassica carinata TaxID=52824 RepID=A0A8X8B652_BRACI|nr:hypothetical protein Bca52824_016201 [Brassica carinata]